ncbi:MAG: tetratricopeptide repeat protein [Bacteroidia bacterium]
MRFEYENQKDSRLKLKSGAILAGEISKTSPEEACQLCEEVLIQLDSNTTIEFTKLQKLKVSTLIRYAISLRHVGDIDNAIKQLLKGLTISEKYDLKESQLHCLGNLASIYKDQSMLEEALFYNRACLKLAVNMGDTYATSIYSGNLGNSLKQTDMDSALYYFRFSAYNESRKESMLDRDVCKPGFQRNW